MRGHLTGQRWPNDGDVVPQLGDERTRADLLLKLFRDRYNPTKLARKLGTTALRLVDRLYDESSPALPAAMRKRPAGLSSGREKSA